MEDPISRAPRVRDLLYFISNHSSSWRKIVLASKVSDVFEAAWQPKRAIGGRNLAFYGIFGQQAVGCVFKSILWLVMIIFDTFPG